MSRKDSATTAGKIGKFIKITLGTAIVGISIGLIAVLAVALFMKESVGFAALGLALAGVLVGYPVGVIVGIILTKKVFHFRGSLFLGILGSVLGVVITMGAAEPLNLNTNPNILFAVFFLSVPILCTIGFLLKS
ncbi:hypothetical protein KA005_55435 [bacterium]|nr:hypothetical protein [bacterium]